MNKINTSAYLKLSNMDKTHVTKQHIAYFMSLARNDDRVESIKHEKENLFDVKTDELTGIYTIGRIAASLYETEKERTERINSTKKEVDIIHITKFKDCRRKLSRKTRQKLYEYAESLKPSTLRAQCITIAAYILEEDETIAERFLRDHVSKPHALRQARILVNIKRANEINKRKNYFGTIVFEDGSKL